MSAAASAPNYVLGHSTHEQERLMLQGRILRPYTDRFLRAAGVVPGMRVLDLGSGMGDVSFVAADIVGPGGRVLGIDRDPAIVERAGRRAVELGCSSWVSFQPTALDDFTHNAHFDAIVGRFVMLYQPKPAATLRRLTQFLRPGGLIVLHEMDFTYKTADKRASFPACPLWDECTEIIAKVFELSGLPVDFGCRLAKTFIDAGLPYPALASETPVGGGRGSYLFPWIASTIASLTPGITALGLSLPPGAADGTLATLMEEEAVASGSQVIGPPQYGAWTRKPA